MTNITLLVFFSIIILIIFGYWFGKEKEEERKSAKEIDEQHPVVIPQFLSQTLINGIITFLMGGLVTLLITVQVQNKSSDIERNFEVHKIKWNEMDSLQKELLKNLTTRVFWLEETYINLENPKKDSPESYNAWKTEIDEASKKYTEYKTYWNTNLLYWHSKLDVLFGEDFASRLVNQEESAVILNQDLSKWSRNEKTVNKAFMAAESIVFSLLSKSQSQPNTLDDGKLKDAKTKIEHLKKLSDCFSHQLTGKILYEDTFDPTHPPYTPPQNCKHVFD